MSEEVKNAPEVRVILMRCIPHPEMPLAGKLSYERVNGWTPAKGEETLFIEKSAYDRLEKALIRIRNLELSTGALENEAYDICDEALGKKYDYI